VQQVSRHLVSPATPARIAKTSPQNQFANLDPQLRILMETAFTELGNNERERMDELAKQMQSYLREHKKLFHEDYFRQEVQAIIRQCYLSKDEQTLLVEPQHDKKKQADKKRLGQRVRDKYQSLKKRCRLYKGYSSDPNYIESSQASSQADSQITASSNDSFRPSNEESDSSDDEDDDDYDDDDNIQEPPKRGKPKSQKRPSLATPVPYLKRKRSISEDKRRDVVNQIKEYAQKGLFSVFVSDNTKEQDMHSNLSSVQKNHQLTALISEEHPQVNDTETNQNRDGDIQDTTATKVNINCDGEANGEGDGEMEVDEAKKDTAEDGNARVAKAINKNEDPFLYAVYGMSPSGANFIKCGCSAGITSKFISRCKGYCPGQLKLIR
jgi:hypothetical protein